jgi:nicotinate-nucleotide--dimethylbenzimidazole phosphoribosyltransferase
MDKPVADLDEIRALSAHLPGPDLEAGTLAATRQTQLTKPAGALGRLEELAIWLATWQARHPPQLDHPRTLVFAGNHGVAARGVSAYPASVTAQMVQNFIAGGAAINQLCRVFDAGLKVYEMNLDTPTGDIAVEPAMSEEECAKAMAYGMMAVEPGIDVLALGEMGIGNTTAAACLTSAFTGAQPELTTGRGAGLDDARLEHKRAIVAAAIRRARPKPTDPLGTLAELGGFEIAALVGAALAAAARRVPVVLDGYITTSAALAAVALAPNLRHSLIAAHRSAEPGHRVALEYLGLQPLLTLEMRLGEGSGAALALPIIRGATRLMRDMATFEQAGVDDKVTR